MSIKRRMGITADLAIGDERKSWDLLMTIEYIGRHLGKSDPILDIGCYGSEIVVALHALGYANLTGVDLNPNVCRMPHADKIRYQVADFAHTGHPNASFLAITAISVIEHGLNAPRLLREMSRILRPGGYFIASFDYWPTKIVTSGIKIFDLDWQIFSAAETQAFIELAATVGLMPICDLRFDASDRTISFEGLSYTFAWLALQKVG
jgi:SAM-dependent methyltransferase